MNRVAEEMRAILEGDESVLMHYGTKFHSGRYPYGSGEDPYQHSGDFLARVEQLKKDGLSETKIAETIGLSTTDLRMQIRVANHERKRLEYDRIKSLADKGLSATKIGEIVGKNESSIRSILKADANNSRSRAEATAEILKKELETKGILDVGAGVERELGVSRGTLKEALFMLRVEGGYQHFGIGMPQVNNQRQQFNLELIAKSDKDVKELQKEIYADYGLVKSVRDYHSEDGGLTYNQLRYPASLDSKRVGIRYAEEGGLTKDGVMEIRRGVADLNLGNSHYAQVRILVDDTHYLKGMAMYGDSKDWPEGVDIMFNTNKKVGTDKMEVLKPIKEDDPDNPFGANIKANGQSTYLDKDGKEKLSPINKLKEEGEWDTSSSKNLSSQFLSKQPMKLINQQLKLTYSNALSEYDEICSLENPTIKRKLLLDFADNCDGATVHLKAAALPRQKTQVILPIDALKETECYAPNFRDGETVYLVRYPHGGTFEIPKLTVNNKNKTAKSILSPDVQDAIGINSKVAEKLSGADFDGDTVIVIPANKKVKIKTDDTLADLKNFDPKTQYSTEGKKGVRLMSESEKQIQMGIVSNLITDMTLRGAEEHEIARAVKHSMVVIDALKHKLDYKQSERDQGIAELKKVYQKRYIDDEGTIKEGGASTLISMKKQTVRVPETRGSGIIDPETGKVSYKLSGRTYIDKKGQVQEATKEVKRITTVDDAYTLSSGTPQENAYADYVNKMKALANQARKESVTTPRLVYSASAAKLYEKEVEALTNQLDIAARNSPKERQAHAIANSVVKAKTQDNPDMSKSEIKKLKTRELNKARDAVGAGRKDSAIKITDKQWEAIQAGAISDSRLSQILRYADAEEVRKRATPRATTTLSSAQVSRIKALSASGHTNQEIADIMGKSTSTISKYLKGGE